jgi:hypothetical protein
VLIRNAILKDNFIFDVNEFIILFNGRITIFIQKEILFFSSQYDRIEREKKECSQDSFKQEKESSNHVHNFIPTKEVFLWELRHYRENGEIV